MIPTDFLLGTPLYLGPKHGHHGESSEEAMPTYQRLMEEPCLGSMTRLGMGWG